jgi:uncharacterized protein YoxC
MVKKNNMKLLNLIQENNKSVIKEGNTLQTIFKTVEDAKTLKSVNPSLFKTLEDIIKFGKAEGKPVEGYTAANKTNRTVINNVDDLVYSIKAGGMTAETMGQFYKGMLKSANTPRSIINEIVPEIIIDKGFVNTYGKMTEKEMATELRNRKYSDAAIEEILGQTKKNPNWKNTRKVGIAERKAKRTNSGKNTTQTPTTDGSGVPPQQTKTLTERTKELIDNIKNKKMSWGKLVAWAAGIGIGVTALWWWLYNNSDTIPDGTPETEPKDNNSEWAPCIKELIDSKEGTLTTLEGGGIVVVQVITPEYPEGLNFTSNGRVADIKTKKMGSWKCKGTTPVIAESQKISISGLLKEQSSEVDVKTMSNYVDVAVDDLDGFVDTGNLTSLLNILKALNGKTFQGKNAISEFLSLYKEDEGGDDFVADVNSVGVKTLGSEAILAKREVIALAKSGGTATTTTPDTTKSGKVGLSKIDITWDGEKSKDDGSKPIVKPVKKETNYHDCSTKEVFEFGCISPKIAEIQGCLGITPQKGYFGPKTRKALTDMFGETSLAGGITKDMYDKVMASCDESKVSARKKYSPEELKTIPAEKLKQTTGLKTGDIKMPDITPLADTNKGERIYKLFQGNYETRNQEGNENDSYLFQEGNRIKYKGAALSQENLDLLSGYISSLGYDFMKAKPKDDYEFKYVWLKR